MKASMEWERVGRISGVYSSHYILKNFDGFLVLVFTTLSICGRLNLHCLIKSKYWPRV
jgi:hypothetical protein